MNVTHSNNYRIIAVTIPPTLPLSIFLVATLTLLLGTSASQNGIAALT